MSINLVTYANQTVTPTNDAIIYEKAVDQNGIFYGCNVTVSGNNVNITGGYGIVCGREFVIESESIPVTLAPSVTLLGRLYVRLDLADADNPIQLLTAQGGTLPALEQDANVNFVNGVWEMELATFDVGVSSLSDVVETFETIVGSKQIPSAIADYIVEEGTDGDWTYRKWNSGIAECWGLHNKTTAVNTSWGNLYRSGDITMYFPSGFFNVAPISASIFVVGSNSVMIMNTGVAPTNEQIRINLVRSSSASNSSYDIQVRCIGTWK